MTDCKAVEQANKLEFSWSLWPWLIVLESDSCRFFVVLRN